MKRLLITAASDLRNSPLPSLEERELCVRLKAAGLGCDGTLYVGVCPEKLQGIKADISELPAPAQLLYWSHTGKKKTGCGLRDFTQTRYIHSKSIKFLIQINAGAVFS